MVDMLPPGEQQLPLWEDPNDPDHEPYVDWGESVGATVSAASVAMTHITGVLQRLASARQEPPDEEELRGWLATPPIDWPETPRLGVWQALDAADDQLRYEVPEGHLRNLLDEAVEVLVGLGVLDA